MKANELMVGDFVMMGKKTYRCANICGHTNDVLLDNGVITNVGNLTPIPLTPEILEKNGFTHSFGDSDFYDYEKWEKKVDDKTIRVIKDHDGWFCRVDDNKLTRSMGIAPAVHTMQNIIRIGGIEKTIEL